MQRCRRRQQQTSFYGNCKQIVNQTDHYLFMHELQQSRANDDDVLLLQFSAPRLSFIQIKLRCLEVWLRKLQETFKFQFQLQKIKILYKQTIDIVFTDSLSIPGSFILFCSLNKINLKYKLRLILLIENLQFSNRIFLSRKLYRFHRTDFQIDLKIV